MKIRMKRISGRRLLNWVLTLIMVAVMMLAQSVEVSAACYPVDGQNYSSLEYDTSGKVSKITCHFSYDDSDNIRFLSDKDKRYYNMIFTTTEPYNLSTEGFGGNANENVWERLISRLNLQNSVFSSSTAVGVNGVTYSDPKTSSGKCNVSGTYTLTDTTTLSKLQSGQTYYGLLCSTNGGVWYTSTYVKIVYVENPVAYIRRGNVTSYFTTLDNAIQNAQSDDTIVLLKNCTLNSSSNFSENKTIDLNGKYINITGSLSANNKIKIKDSANSSRDVFTNTSTVSYNNAARFTSAQSNYIVTKNSNGQLEFTYLYTAIFKVNNGKWNDGTTADKKVIITSSDHKIGNNIPSVGNMPNTGYKKSGSWDPTLTTGTTINGVTTYTYTYEAKGSQTIQANNVSATYGDTDKSVSANVTSPLTGGGAISYAVKSGSETYINVDSSSGALTIKQVPPSGKAYVTVTAAETDNYNKATKEVTVTIAKANINPTVNITGWTYNNTANQPTVSGNSGSGSVTYTYAAQGSDNYSAATPTDAGSYTVKAVVAQTTNYNGGEATANFVIAKANITPTVTLNGWTYNGIANQPTVSGNSGNGAVTITYAAQGSDSYAAATPTNAGSYTVKAAVAETANYNAAVATANFTIAKADFSPTASYGSWTYGETAGTGSVSVNPENGTVTWTYSTSQTGTYSTAKPTNAGTYYAKATVGETANYNSATTAPVSFTIAKADIHPTVSMENWTEGYRASEPEITGVMEDADVLFTYARRGSENFTDRRPSASARYVVKATVAETANYNGAEVTAEFSIYVDDSSDLTVTSPLTTVTRVTMNGTVINSRYYTVSGGSVYFIEGFLESLKPGVYTIKVTDGNTVATTTYRVSGGETGSVVLSATTADHGVALYAALAVSATLGLGYMGKKRKED